MKNPLIKLRDILLHILHGEVVDMYLNTRIDEIEQKLGRISSKFFRDEEAPSEETTR